MKILVFALIDTFVKGIITHLQKKHEVLLVPVTGGVEVKFNIDFHNPDIVWFEFCDKLIIQCFQQYELSNQNNTLKHINFICRIHSYELFTPLIHNVYWDDSVNNIIFVGEHTKALFEANIKLNKTKTHVIYNGLDFGKYFNKKTKYGKKLAYVGYLNHKKNIPLLLYCFDRIAQWDCDYTLHIAGEFQDNRLKLYFEDFLRKNDHLIIKFDGWIDDIPKWLKDKDYIFSTSLFESFHYGAMEGIASGLLPLIHNWYGAETLYPNTCLFNTPTGCLNLLQAYENSDKIELSKIFLKHIARYDKELQYKKIDKLIENL